MSALLNGLPVSACFESSSSLSLVSVRLNQLCHPVLHQHYRAALSVPTENGYFTSLVDLLVTDAPLQSDVVLGLDWLAIARTATLDCCILLPGCDPHLSTPVQQLNPGGDLTSPVSSNDTLGITRTATPDSGRGLSVPVPQQNLHVPFSVSSSANDSSAVARTPACNRRFSSGCGPDLSVPVPLQDPDAGLPPPSSSSTSDTPPMSAGGPLGPLSNNGRHSLIDNAPLPKPISNFTNAQIPNAEINFDGTHDTDMHDAETQTTLSSLSLTPDPSPVHMAASNLSLSDIPPGLALIKRVFFSKHQSGSRTSVFTSDLNALRSAMSTHAIPFIGLSLHQCRIAYIYHLLSGSCAEYEKHVQSPSLDHSSCHNIAAGYLSSSALSSAALEIIVSTDLNLLDTEKLLLIAEALGMPSLHSRINVRRDVLAFLRQKCAHSSMIISDARHSFIAFEKLPKASLIAIASQHGLKIPQMFSTVDGLRRIITDHISWGNCAMINTQQCVAAPSQACSSLVSEYSKTQQTSDVSTNDLQIYILSSIINNISLNSLRRLLQLHDVPFSTNDSLSKLRRELKKYITRLKKGKRAESDHHKKVADQAEFLRRRKTLQSAWPQLIPTNLKQKIIKLFREQTSKAALSSFTCAACAKECLNINRHDMQLHEFDLNLLHCPERLWSDPDCPSPPFPYIDGPLKDVLVDPAGVTVLDDSGNLSLMLCPTCQSSLKNNKVPPLALANHTFLGPIPDELKDLTVVEEAMIARCRAKCWVVQLKEENPDLVLPNAQHGVKGHIIIYPQHPSDLAQCLPPSIDDIITPICVLFVGSSPPSTEWLRDKAKPLAVRREKVRAALLWLKQHNRLYKDITINHGILDELADNQILPFHIEHVLPNDSNESLTSRYDASAPLHSNLQPQCHDSTIPFQNVVITDVDGHAPANELRAAAVRHIKKKGGGYIEIPHDAKPVNEFFNPDLFPMIYPTLFPYGIGGFEDSMRPVKISMKRHAKHLFNLADHRFQEHYSFLFTVFNILQRRAILLHTGLKVKKSKFHSIAADFAAVSQHSVHVVSERIAQGDFATANNDEERQVLKLMKEVKTITSNVPGSSASRVAMRNEIRGLMMDQGLPSFYITINPADVFNPLVKFLAGEDIDIDNLLPEQVPNYWEQSILVAKNPAIAAKFFNIYMKAFISAILGYDPKQKNLDGGILGVVKAYYGCVEAQGRGTLHCHMLVWVEGGLNPNEIKQRVLDDKDNDFRGRLLAFLDDTISNCIPPDPDPNLIIPSSIYHPCSVRGIPSGLSGDDLDKAHQKDIHHLVKQCQSHSHSKTCYKYWKGNPHPKECRFNLDENNTCAESHFDDETGEICLRCLDGMVNNFNSTILEAVRCNMDIKFIGSGASAKAILYYITDYITKSQLKTHVAYAALELAVKKLGDYDPAEDEYTNRAKRLLQKCAYAMISHQELSAQQVASYLMDFEDHFTSHQYQNLYWTSFEKFINDDSPSPECYVKPKSSASETLPDNEQIFSSNFDNSDINNEDVEDIGISNDEDLENVESDDIAITVNSSGELVPKSSQVADYHLRGSALEAICVWDYISQVEKISKSSDKRKHKTSHTCTESENNISAENDSQDNDDDIDDDCGLDDENDVFNLLTCKQRKRPRVPLLPNHLETISHILRIRAPDNRLVPVPIGPGIPRRDREDVKPKYCRLMLILFKPWRRASDLRASGQSWIDAFNTFLIDCPPPFKAIMNNMQILHECRDSRDDHFAERRSRWRSHSNNISRELMGTRDTNDDFVGENNTEELILEHLESIDSCNSHRSYNTQNAVLQCIQYAEASGMYHHNDKALIEIRNNLDPSWTQEVNEATSDLEDTWRKAYEARRDKWKQKSQTQNSQTSLSNTDCQAQEVLSASNLIRDGSAFRNALSENNISRVPAIRQEIPATNPNQDVNITEMISEFTLNIEQARAFKIITEHSLESKPEPLRMYLGGPGGTGKSRVINAIKEYFVRRGQDRRFRLASYTGVAARNISGMTLHAALNLNQRTKAGSKGKTRRDLIAMWEGVDYLFIDEISMVGCAFLLDISEALTEAKGNTSAFGGINVIFAGDFAQLPPVGQNKLFSHLDTNSTTSKGQKNIYGKLLWLSVKTVVILNEVMRQSGPENEQFVSLLGRLREGRCTENDFKLLTSHVIANAQPNGISDSWKNVPIIVSENAAKDALNSKAAVAFAQQTGRELHWYHSTDMRGNDVLSDPALKARLESLHSGQTNQRLGKLPLVIGMPVMISQNFDVEGGVVNGCIGTLKRIRYRVDADGNRHAISCVVHASDMSGDALPSLPDNHAVALEDTIDMTFRHPHSGKKCLIKRTQLPIIPAFAMTAHKAQGQTLQKAIVDLESCKGTESPYVMISRVKSLDGLLILRPFRKAKITCHQSQDVRTEHKRLEILRLQTVMEVGSDSESATAQAKLSNLGLTSMIGQDSDNVLEDDSQSHGSRRLHRLQHDITRLMSNHAHDAITTGKQTHQTRIRRSHQANPNGTHLLTSSTSESILPRTTSHSSDVDTQVEPSLTSLDGRQQQSRKHHLDDMWSPQPQKRQS